MCCFSVVALGRHAHAADLLEEHKKGAIKSSAAWKVSHVKYLSASHVDGQPLKLQLQVCYSCCPILTLLVSQTSSLLCEALAVWRCVLRAVAGITHG